MKQISSKRRSENAVVKNCSRLELPTTLFPPFDKDNLKVSSPVNIKNLICCFWNWIQGENSSNYILTLDVNQEPMDYISQIKDGVIAGQHFDELIAK